MSQQLPDMAWGVLTGPVISRSRLVLRPTTSRIKQTVAHRTALDKYRLLQSRLDPHYVAKAKVEERDGDQKGRSPLMMVRTTPVPQPESSNR